MASGRQTIVIRPGEILAKFVGLERYPIVIPCFFHEERPADVPSLLGLDSLRPRIGPKLCYTFDGRSTANFPLGHLAIDLE
jgi:hypothetical protein